MVAEFPRLHLGHMVYRPRPGPDSDSLDHLMPRFDNRENCVFQIRIPRRFLYEKERMEIFKRRELWGTDVYSDDSDIIAVLMHIGKLPPALPEDVDLNLVMPDNTPALPISAGSRHLDETPAATITKKGRVSVKSKAAAAAAAAAAASAAATSNGGSSDKTNGTTSAVEYLDVNKDVVVDVLILPPLERYATSVRNALKSRYWEKHDGMSFMVHDVKNVEPGEAESRGRAMRKQRLDEREHIRKWGTLPGREGEGGLSGLGKVGKVAWEAKVGA